MRIYYFTRTGRSREIAEELARRHGVSAEKIDDRRDWDGKENYRKAAEMAMNGESVPIEYSRPGPEENDIAVVCPLWAGAVPPAINTFADEVGKERITLLVTSISSKLLKREGYKKVVDVVGKEISCPEGL